ncbi:glycerol transport system ATP-binding protein [Deinococcus metalli]|uniref:ABC transporter ATP-binding protein n=1 Tax=Deinococcus metalli TaxID=1141878 RepID=A0A7W8NMJ7_9DEIO|nr:ABC transporter ATP-binding protein [Deinococcus metalli]MBB5375874.1 glycerol transport system ATP-binding protein [Deinococcus metalli]GHF36389.1 ABC transporter ATP-binding protein [Deinococcus metalli]
MTLTLDAVSRVVQGQTHLYPLTLTLHPGLNVLLGPTLAGKTSLMRIMAGLDQPSAGRVLVDGQDVTGVNVQKRSVAFVYQQFVNYPNFTVFENIASPLRIAGVNAADIGARVHDVAALMHLEPMLGRLPAELSGGQQQRVAIARALVKDADLLLFDEPLVNLDYKLREELRAEMQGIFARRSAVVVYSTTEPFEALTLGGQVAVLSEGRLLQAGNTLEVYHHPATMRVGQVFSDPPINLLDATLGGGQGQLAGGERFALPPHLAGLDGAYRLGVRANHAGLRPEGPDDLPMGAVVNIAELSGSETYLHTRLGAGDGAHLVAQLPGIHPVTPGQAVTLHVSPRRMFAFDSAGALAAAPSRTLVEVNA